ncbi:hypothetical protein NEOC95_002042 [Neochlamydia sp. AcF95]|nr:hypothetical protein [Neochlamydia sp. AcF95]
MNFTQGLILGSLNRDFFFLPHQANLLVSKAVTDLGEN